jgi:hypothetical protein
VSTSIRTTIRPLRYRDTEKSTVSLHVRFAAIWESQNRKRRTKRCTGVAAGGFSVFRDSTGRNPVNAVVIPGRITSSAFRQVGDSVMAGKSSFQFHRLFRQQMCRCPACSVRKMFYSLHSCCDRDHSLTVMTGTGTQQSDTLNPIESEATCGVRSSFGNSSDCSADIWAS